MKPTFLLITAALAGCVTVQQADAPSTEPYRALGTEPFWSVTIAGARMSYDAPDGPRFSVPAPPPRSTFNGHRFETRRLAVDVTHSVCSDGMSDRRYADTVMVIVDGQSLRGCGGDILAPAGLADTGWMIVAIGDEAVRGDNYFLNFAPDRLSGQAGCNRFSGNYLVEGETLTAGMLAATRMACPGPLMDHEGRVVRLLGEPVRISFPDGDTLVLTGNGGSIRLRRSI